MKYRKGRTGEEERDCKVNIKQARYQVNVRLGDREIRKTKKWNTEWEEQVKRRRDGDVNASPH